MSPKVGIPRPALARLPLYYRYLVEAVKRGETTVSSEAIGQALGLPGAQVRKDLSYVHEYGRAGVGYAVDRLAASLEEFLGLANDKEAIVVGAGRLGQALASYPGFDAYGLRIIALFDVDPVKIGQEVAGRPVFPMSKMANLVQRLHIQMGIITVPATAAQSVAEAMAQTGITVIWNFAPVHLSLPDCVYVENEDLAARLATLSYHIVRLSQRLGTGDWGLLQSSVTGNGPLTTDHGPLPADS